MDGPTKFQLENSTGKWFVEADGKVYGPATENTIMRSLLQAEIGPLTKIRGPDGTWKPLCEYPKFGEVARRLKTGEPLPKEVDDGRAQDFAEHTLLSKGILDQLQLANVRGSGEQEAEANVPPLPSQDRAQARPQGVQAARVLPPPQKVDSLLSKGIRYGLLLAVVALIWLGYSLYKAREARMLAEEERRKAEVALEEARQAEREGRYDRALGRVDAAANARKRDMPLQVQRAKMLVANNRFEEAQNYLKTAMETLAEVDGDSADKSQAEIELDPFVACIGKCLLEAKSLLGLVALKQGRLDEAEKLLKAALELKGDYSPAHFSLGALYLVKGDLYKAEGHFLDAVSPAGEQEAEVLLALIHTAGELFKTKSEFAMLGKADLVANEFMNRSWSLRQELYLGRAYLAALSHDKTKALDFLLKALDVDPDLSSHEARDPRYIRLYSNWPQLNHWMEVVAAELGAQIPVRTMQALVAQKLGEKLKGLQIQEGLVGQNPKDSLVLTIYAYLQTQWGRKGEADAALSAALSASPKVLTYILRANSCTASQNWTCVQESFESILKVDRQNVTAMVGLADALMKQGKLEPAKPHVKKALELAPGLVPARKLATELLEKGVAL